MQSFDTKADHALPSSGPTDTLVVGRIEDLRPGACVRFELPEGDELAVCNVGGEYYAIENFCPHKGAPLADGHLSAHAIECDWHGWRFDLRTGECLTNSGAVETYEVVIDDGWIKIRV